MFGQKAKLYNTLQNLITNLGTAKDKRSASKFIEKELASDELIAMYRSDWLSGKIIDAPVEDMIRKWISLSAPSIAPEQIKLIEAVIEALKVMHAMEFGLKYGGLFGGELVYMHLEGAIPKEPLEIETVKQDQLLKLALVEKSNVGKIIFDEDVESPTFGEIIAYEINKKEVHASRLLRFDGLVLPKSINTSGWSNSLLQRYFDAIVDVSEFNTIINSMAHEAKKDIVKIPGLMQLLTTHEGTEILIERFQGADMIKSINNMLVIDQDEEYAQTQIAFGGLDAILKIKLHIASAASDIPVVRLIGTSAPGLSATGEVDRENYYDMISSKQETKLRPELEKLFQVLVRSAIGSYPEDFSFKFNALWQPNEKAQAVIDSQNATRDASYLQNQVLIPSQVARQLQQQGTYSFITDEYIAALEQLEGSTGEGSE